MRSSDRPTVRWCNLGSYRVCFERYAHGARFAVHGKRDLSAGYSRPRIIASGVLGGAGVVYDAAELEAELERELLECWASIDHEGTADERS